MSVRHTHTHTHTHIHTHTHTWRVTDVTAVSTLLMLITPLHSLCEEEDTREEEDTC